MIRNKIKDLQKLKSSHSKVQDILYNSLKVQTYISDFQTKDTQLLFKLRSRMINVRANFKNYYRDSDISCNLCLKGTEENQAHLLECETLIENCQQLHDDYSVEYEDIFEETEKQLKATRLFQAVLETRERLLEEKTS